MTSIISSLCLIFLLLSSTSFSLNEYPSSSLSINHIRVIDADTIIDESNKERIRIACINSPEVSTDEGLEASSLTKNFLEEAHHLTLYRLGTDLYGRTIAILENQDKLDLATYLLTNKAAIYKPYDRVSLCKKLYLTPDTISINNI